MTRFAVLVVAAFLSTACVTSGIDPRFEPQEYTDKGTTVSAKSCGLVFGDQLGAAREKALRKAGPEYIGLVNQRVSGHPAGPLLHCVKVTGAPVK